MSDPTLVTSPIVDNTQHLTPTQQVEKDTLLTVEEALKIFSLFKSGGAKAALGEFSAAAGIIKQDVVDVKVALPEIKNGFKTSEFWAMVLAGVGIVYPVVIGHPLNPIVSASIAGLAAIYALVRGALKSKVVASTSDAK